MCHVLRDTCCYAQTVGNTPTLPLEFCKSARPRSFLPSFNHIVRSPSNSANRRNLTLASGFMKMSAGFLSVGMYWTNNFLSSTASHMKWYRTLICLVREWYLLSLDNAIAPWLSLLIVIQHSSSLRSSARNVHSPSASFAACAWATYSASTVDKATICCFFELQLTAPRPNR